MSDLYRELTGAAWQTLDPAVRRLHRQTDGVVAHGVFQVQHGPGRAARWLAWLLGMPAEGPAPVRLLILPHGQGERWVRAFGQRLLISEQQGADPGVLRERWGLLELDLQLVVEQGALHYRQRGAALRLGPLRLPLPRWLALHTAGSERPSSQGTTVVVSVEVALPLLGPLISYEGLLAPG